jgi:3-phosphoshikimate 1-carboxyvinyltransferase
LIKGGFPKYKTESGPINLNLRESGTTTRLILGICSILPIKVNLTGDDSLKRRPLKELLDKLVGIEVNIHYYDKEGYLPLSIYGNDRPKGGLINIRGDISSQFISALLIISPFMQNGLEINITSRTIVSKSYIDLTLSMMNEFGIAINERTSHVYSIQKQNYQPADIYCEGDYTTASYIMAITALIGGSVRLDRINKDTMQGDRIIIDILKRMGCTIEWVSYNRMIMVSKGKIYPVEWNMVNNPDLVPTIAVLCAFADGISILKGVSHLKYKESDRIQAIRYNLDQFGIKTEYKLNNLIIHGKKSIENKSQKVINTYNDHRIAMSFTVMGLKRGNIVIDNEDCVTKSFPGFWDMVKGLY